MRQRHTIRPGDLCQPTWTHALADALGLTDYSQSVTRTALAKCLLLAAALRVAVSAITRRATDLGREAVRKGLDASRPDDPRVLEDRFATALRHARPRRFRRRPVPVALDIHRRPYYGDQNTPAITGGQAEAGTAYFWSYATVTVLRAGHRHTLALTAVGPDDDLTDVVERLLTQVVRTGVRVRYVLLDRAFYAAGVVCALQKRNLRFVIPMVRRGQQAARFFVRGCRGWFEHTFESRRREYTATVRVAVVPGSDGNRPLVFACSNGFGAPAQVALVYGRRFGIESSYRQLGECLAQTTSRDVVYRLLLVCVSVLIRCWWVRYPGRALHQWRLELILVLAAPIPEQPDGAAQTPTLQPHTTT